VALEADFGAGLSVEDAAAAEPALGAESDDPVDALSDDDAVSVVDVSDVFLPVDDLRSTLAQPEPLNTMAGATNALRIAAPHTGHAVGPVSWTPCITSVRWPLTHT
jgi:hypothetical protein